jgi:hypothetical protein
LAPPVLLFGPLAGLLLLTRPASVREWLCLMATGIWTVLWLNQGGGLAAQVGRAGAVLLIGTFLALTVWRPSGRFSRALAATAVAGVALTLWMWRLDIAWGAVRRAVENELWTYNRELMVQLGVVGDTGFAGQGLLDQMSATVRTIGAFYPALFFLAGLAGLRLAWSWYHRIVARPVGPAPTAFAAFKFNDQLVWGWVAGLGLCLLPWSPAWTGRAWLSGVLGRIQASAAPSDSDSGGGRHVSPTVRRGRADPAWPGRHLARFPASPGDVDHLRKAP